MTAIDDLLARSALLKNPHIPADTVPCLTTHPGPTLPPDASIPAQETLADGTAAEHLRSLCEVAVTHASAPQITDFITEQLPGPEGAWILGCLLHLAGAEDGARYWWQYAAGAGDRGAGYCLSLHHRARGDDQTADFWLDQADGDADTDSDAGCAASTATVLRMIVQMTADSDRTYSDTTLAVMSYTTAAVSDGYRRHPDVEIPAPGPYFAEMLQVILGALTDPDDNRTDLTAGALPARPVEDDMTTRPNRAPDPDHVLVQFAAPDAESASAFHEAALAHAWTHLPPEQPQRPGQREVLMRFLLDRRRLSASGLACARDAAARSGV
ncbi:hypothetical protein SAM40697_6897 [Streptomyces ambofaciens]|uniref:Uncharacterized protein n=1 Tax=Streptomyces ambofaciens TaxID=1889 RepID=Q0JWP8_STRAM|nr:hypothetical protein [Streptomyces ambofaciens]ANB03991.1 hypothetical protein SAM40697_0028 [Streptomyces ambofaciens]ANB10849.1 hypothetical protein SAM40697_6897 [Streptomyces ambofaciens]CAK50872.1 conserved hypothetical protein [Streptomyces ambofaciens]CAK51110.1 conserved hypothetical protein [Streptomyces ambofaciens]